MPAARSSRSWAASRAARYLSRATVVGVLAAGFVAVGASPASAHGLTGAQPTNFASRVLSVSPAVDGLTVSVRDLGSRLEVRNVAAYDVVILGYQGEPYLRVGPKGVYENRRSPSVFLNRAQTITAEAPPSYDAAAPPEWHRIGSGHAVFWHDHRIHWMGASEPPAVRADPGRVHVVSNWLVTLQYRGRDVIVTGDLRWVPGPSAWPRLALALVVAVLVIGFGLTRWWGAALGAVLSALAVIVAILVAGEWSATSAGPWIALLSTVYSVVGVLVALAAAAALVRSRRDPSQATAIVLVAAVILTFGSGLADVTFLTRSQLLTTLPDPLARTLVAIVLGGSLGVLVAAARTLRRPAIVSAGGVPSSVPGAPPAALPQNRGH